MKGSVSMPKGPINDRYTTSVQAVLAERWTENDGRTAVAERCAGRCEGCSDAWHGQVAHRIFKSQGLGYLWHPANLLALCGSGTTGCHGWAHHNRAWAKGFNWELPTGTDPTTVPAWLRDPYDPTRCRWALLDACLDAEGIRRHVVREVEPRWVA